MLDMLFADIDIFRRAEVPPEVLMLLLLVGLIIALWDFFDRKRKALQQTTGLSSDATMVALQGSEQLPSHTFYSKELGLKSTPDALCEESGFLIPMDIKPKARKVQDRHLIEMVAHLRLIEEETGKIPPYGLLILGEDRRRVEIKNTPERQRHLECLLDEMHSIDQGVPAVPAPSFYKCKNCDVRSICAHSAFTPHKNS